MTSFELEVIGQDSVSLARSLSLEINGKKAIGPIHGITSRDAEIYAKIAGYEYPDSTINIAGENLGYDTFSQIGTSASAITDLQNRLSARLLNPRKTINIVYPRIPNTYDVDGVIYPHHTITDLQASSIVGAELETGTDIVVTPIPGGVSSRKIVGKVIERTINEIQTFNYEKPMMAYIPRLDDVSLAADIVKEYLRQDKECRIFGVDFSGSSYPSALLRAVIRTIRNSLKIKGNSEKNEKYYLHAFNVATNRKSTKGISPATDVLVHAYGIDTISNVIWGGGPLVPEKCRYMLTDDYGAYRKNEIIKKDPHCTCPTCKKYSLEEIYTPQHVLPGLKVHKMHTFYYELKELSKKIVNSDTKKTYLPYVEAKEHTKPEVKKIMTDVHEILVS
ncbi:MAG: hypothetical protein V1875_05270 [Candidatus Altiarchaeota archaeon]